MATFPGGIVSPTDPTSGSLVTNPSHALEHQSHNAEIVAVETKIGTGAATPTSGKVLRSSGTGTSTWGQVVLSTDVASATSADLRGILSDETGTGGAVFGTSPTITTPIITSPAITTPNITTSINDSSGNEVIKTPATAAATNEITVTNAANGNFPTISATGSSDANVDLLLIGKGTGSARHAGPYDGWVAANETWTYASATTFTTASSALAGVLQVGDRIKLTQTTVKYFYVIGISGTTITITGGTDYTLANAAITLPFYSHEVSPTGFPAAFNFTATWTGVTAQFASVNRFSVIGRKCRVHIFRSTNQTSNATSLTVTLPIPAATVTGMGWQMLGSNAVDNGGALTSPPLCEVLSAGTVVTIYKDPAAGAWTGSSTKGANVNAEYEI